MKKSIIISTLFVSITFAIQAQPKYTKMASNQSAYKVKNLEGYKETGSAVENRNQFRNAQSYKNGAMPKPEAKGTGIFPVLPDSVNENGMVASGNYKSQFKSTNAVEKVRGQTLPVNDENDQTETFSRKEEE